VFHGKNRQKALFIDQNQSNIFATLLQKSSNPSNSSTKKPPEGGRAIKNYLKE
jgi:hypothetical protein